MEYFVLDLDLSENPVADKRLLKLIQQCRTKQVLDYVKQHGEVAPKAENANGTRPNQKSDKSKKSKKSESSDDPKYMIYVQRHTVDTVKVCKLNNCYVNFVNTIFMQLLIFIGHL